MNNKITIKVLGTRGSMPCSSEEFQIYGGNTSCFFLPIQDQAIVFDAGTGIMALNKSLPKTIKDIHIFISHMHLDHIQGLPFFQSLFESNYSITIYGQERSGKTIQEQIDYFLNPLLWPVGVKNFQPNVQFVTVQLGKKYQIREDIVIETAHSCHPGASTLYRITYKDSSFVYGLDFEHNEDSLERLISFSQNATALVYDSCYFPEEYPRHKGWGHSTWEQGLFVKKRANIDQLLLSHHNINYTDTMLQTLAEQLSHIDNNILLLKEGMEIHL